jgi:hypothetical protein
MTDLEIMHITIYTCARSSQWIVQTPSHRAAQGTFYSISVAASRQRSTAGLELEVDAAGLSQTTPPGWFFFGAPGTGE